VERAAHPQLGNVAHRASRRRASCAPLGGIALALAERTTWHRRTVRRKDGRGRRGRGKAARNGTRGPRRPPEPTAGRPLELAEVEVGRPTKARAETARAAAARRPRPSRMLFFLFYGSRRRGRRGIARVRELPDPRGQRERVARDRLQWRPSRTSLRAEAHDPGVTRAEHEPSTKMQMTAAPPDSPRTTGSRSAEGGRQARDSTARRGRRSRRESGPRAAGARSSPASRGPE